jgi:hypothetical protein
MIAAAAQQLPSTRAPDGRVAATSNRCDLAVSLVMMLGILVFADVALALDDNWPKVLRISCAFLAYSTVLRVALRSARTHDGMPEANAGGPAGATASESSVKRRWFMAAGLCAGLASGALQPVFEARVLAMQAVAAALLLGPMHWLGLRSWRRVAHRLENEPNTSR